MAKSHSRQKKMGTPTGERPFPYPFLPFLFLFRIIFLYIVLCCVATSLWPRLQHHIVYMNWNKQTNNSVANMEMVSMQNEARPHLIFSFLLCSETGAQSQVCDMMWMRNIIHSRRLGYLNRQPTTDMWLRCTIKHQHYRLTLTTKQTVK